MATTESREWALSIAEAARASGLSAHTLRYYERTGLLEPVTRDGSGHRRYREVDLERISFLAKLRATGMPIREVYLSHRTVESHLYRIFPKLGITSRVQLRAALPEPAHE